MPVQAGLNPFEGKSDIWLYAIPGLCALSVLMRSRSDNSNEFPDAKFWRT